LRVAPGRRSGEALLEAMDDGIYVRQLIGFGQSNLINGDFAANLGLGYRVRDGRVVGRLKDTMIAGNVYELLGGDVELSSDVDPVRRVPWAVVEGLSVSAAQ
ncbi:unnamed protein product, partial [marine sediment metagenome]